MLDIFFIVFEQVYPVGVVVYGVSHFFFFFGRKESKNKNYIDIKFKVTYFRYICFDLF